MAHIENETLVPDNDDARQVLEKLGSKPHHLRGDRFAAKPRPDVPERAKPTTRQRQARRRNIKKAQAVRGKTRNERVV
jgi:phage-related minor tail protein